MSDTGRRVALLARPGAARESVRGALLEIGADIVVEDDPGTATPEGVRDASPDVLMIVLDAISENALDRFDSMLGDPAIEVMFEEADVAAARDGWEAARWRRHLAAKLHHRDDVLPPVAGAAVVPSTDALSLRIEELIGDDAVDFASEAVVDLPMTASGGDDFSIEVPAQADPADAGDDLVLTVHGLEFEASALDAPLPPAGGFDLELELDSGIAGASSNDVGLAFEPEDMALDALPPVTGPDFSASDFDPLLAELDAELPEATAAEPVEWNGGLVEAFSAVEVPADEAVGPPPLPGSAFGELSLADDAPAVAAPAAARITGSLDIDELERRISGLSLVEDAPDGTGAVLVLAGIGGPDAVRQLLGALPARFARPVLLRQRLDGARYDRLVTQMQRACPLPVALALPGDPVEAGHVYVIGDDVTLAPDRAAFASGPADGLLDRLEASNSAVVVLSGADIAQVDRVCEFGRRGALVAAQSADGCYDAAASDAVAVRGTATASPADIASQLAARWGR